MTRSLRDQAALIAFLDERATRAHDWNGNCCVRFMLAAVEAQFGEAPEMVVDWTDQRTARRAIAKVGGIEAETDRLFESIEPSHAQFGDIGGVDDPGEGFMLTIVEGATLVAPGERGLARRPRSFMVRAWRAGPSRPMPDG